MQGSADCPIRVSTPRCVPTQAGMALCTCQVCDVQLDRPQVYSTVILPSVGDLRDMLWQLRSGVTPALPLSAVGPDLARRFTLGEMLLEEYLILRL